MLSSKAATSYSDVQVETGIADASRTTLIQMLLDGLIESLNAAEGHINRNAISEKSLQLTRASRIVIGLQAALDHEKGGEIAKNLGELYGYVIKRILHINVKNDLDALREIRGLMTQIREAWILVPGLVSSQHRIM